MPSFETYVDAMEIALANARCEIQDAYGYVPDDLTMEVAEVDSDMRGVMYEVSLKGPLAEQVADVVNKMLEG